MRKFTLYVYGPVGTITTPFEVEDDMTEEEIDEYALDVFNDCFSWSYTEDEEEDE